MAKKPSPSLPRRWIARLIPSPELRETLVRVLVATAAIACTAAFVFGGLFVRREVRRDPKFSIESWRIETGELPPWVTPEIEREIKNLRIAEGGPLDLFRRGVLSEVKRRLAASPWIEDVGEVALRYPTSESPGAIVARPLLRVLVAIVHVDGRYYLTDQTGIRLGAAYDEPPHWWFGVPVIVGVQPPVTIPEPGQRWEARDVREGLAVAAVLYREGIHRQYPETPIEAIDITNVGGRLRRDAGDVALLCAGRKLVWGRSPISTLSRTIPLESLVANLRDALERMDETDYRVAKLYYDKPVYDRM